MKVEAVALSDFIHGDISAIEGRVCRHNNGDLVDSGIAGDLERAGLVRIRIAPAATRAPVVEGKAADDGRAQPSSASQAGQALPKPTSNTLTLGGGKIRNRGA
jgi:hypothetical protein